MPAKNRMANDTLTAISTLARIGEPGLNILTVSPDSLFTYKMKEGLTSGKMSQAKDFIREKEI